MLYERCPCDPCATDSRPVTLRRNRLQWPVRAGRQNRGTEDRDLGSGRPDSGLGTSWRNGHPGETCPAESTVPGHSGGGMGNLRQRGHSMRLAWWCAAVAFGVLTCGCDATLVQGAPDAADTGSSFELLDGAPDVPIPSRLLWSAAVRDRRWSGRDRERRRRRGRRRPERDVLGHPDDRHVHGAAQLRGLQVPGLREPVPGPGGRHQPLRPRDEPGVASHAPLLFARRDRRAAHRLPAGGPPAGALHVRSPEPEGHADVSGRGGRRDPGRDGLHGQCALREHGLDGPAGPGEGHDVRGAAGHHDPARGGAQLHPDLDLESRPRTSRTR